MFGVLLALLAAIAIVRRPSRLIALFVSLAIVYALFDQSRWQPWFYQYLAMLAVIAWHEEKNAMTSCRWIVICIYFWSGLQKLNPIFLHQTFPWMLEPFHFAPPAALAFLAPLIESAIAIGLATHRFQRLAVTGALAMHAFILASIGPWGHDHNSVVWPWNIAMGTLVVLLFWRRGIEHSPRALVLLLFGLLPAFSFFDLWDSYLSYSLYSGNQRSATIYLADEVADQLPEQVQQIIDIYDSESKVDTLDLEDWSYAELNVPPYPEMRLFRNIAKHVCANAGNPALMVMEVEAKWTWFGRRRIRAFTCAMLQK